MTFYSPINFIVSVLIQSIPSEMNQYHVSLAAKLCLQLIACIAVYRGRVPNNSIKLRYSSKLSQCLDAFGSKRFVILLEHPKIDCIGLKNYRELLLLAVL